MIRQVRLGNSGLKVSKIILGLMTYGSSDWQKWVLDEKTGIEHIKAAYVLRSIHETRLLLTISALPSYDAGIQTFDTADVSVVMI